MTLQSISEIFLYNITLANESLLNDKDSLKANMWEKYLIKHSNRKFSFTLIRMITHDAKIEYIDSNILFLISNHFFAFFAFDILTTDLYKKMKTYRITRIQKISIRYLISSSLDLVSKVIDDWRRIHNLSHYDFFVNDYISNEFNTLEYFIFDNALDTLLKQKRDVMLIKRDLQNAFKYIFVAKSNW